MIALQNEILKHLRENYTFTENQFFSKTHGRDFFEVRTGKYSLDIHYDYYRNEREVIGGSYGSQLESVCEPISEEITITELAFYIDDEVQVIDNEFIQEIEILFNSQIA